MLGQPPLDEAGDRVCISIDAIEVAISGIADGVAKAGSNRIDENQVRHVEHAERVVTQPEGRDAGRVDLAVQHQPTRPDCTQMKPHRR